MTTEDFQQRRIRALHHEREARRVFAADLVAAVLRAADEGLSRWEIVDLIEAGLEQGERLGAVR